MSIPIDTAIGTKIVFTGNGGYEVEVVSAIDKGFRIGEQYTLSALHVGEWSSELEVVEGVFGQFSTCLFEVVE